MRQFIPRPVCLTCLAMLLVAWICGCGHDAGEDAAPAHDEPDESSAPADPAPPASPAPATSPPDSSAADDNAPPAPWTRAANEASAPSPDARHALDAAGAALARLPDDTTVVLATADLAHLLDQLGRERLTARYPDYAAALAEQLRAATGHDLLDVANLDEVGLDGSGPAGVAWLDAELEVGVAFVAVRDPVRALEALDDIVARADLSDIAREVGDASVSLLGVAEGGAVVLTTDTLYWVFAAPGDERLAGIAAALASDDAGGLVLAGGFRTIGARLGSGRDLAGYVALDRIVAHLAARRETWPDRALAAARRRGAGADEIAALEADAEALRERTERTSRLVEALVGAGGPVGFGIETGDPGLRVELHAVLPEPALVRAVWRVPSALPATLHSSDDELVAAASLMLEPEQLAPLVELVDQMSTSPGAPRLRDRLQQRLAFDAIEALSGAATGEVGVLVTGELPEAVATPVFDGLGVHVVLGIDDADAARTLLERLAAHEALRDHVEPPEDDDDDAGWTWTLPVVGRVRVQLDDDHLVMSTAPTFVDRVLAGQRGQLVRDDGERSRFLIDAGGESAVVVAVDARLLAWWPPPPPPAHAPLPDAGDEPDRAVRRKLRAIEAIDGRIDEAHALASLASRQGLLVALGELATIGVSLRPTDDGVVIRGGLYGKRSVASLVDTWLSTWLEQSLRGDAAELERLHEQRARRVDELEALLDAR